MSDNSDSKTIADQIWVWMNDQRLMKRGCVAWIGAGISKSVGYLDWNELVGELHRRCLNKRITKNRLGRQTPDQLLGLADKCKKANKAEYDATLQECYGNSKANTRRALGYILNIPFKAIITTNYDPLLCDALDVSNERNFHNLRYYPTRLETRHLHEGGSIFHIHGRVPKEDSGDSELKLVLAQSEFDEAYNEVSGSNLWYFLHAVLTECSVLFLGCRINEPQIRMVLQRAKVILDNCQTEKLPHLMLREEPINRSAVCTKTPNWLQEEVVFERELARACESVREEMAPMGIDTVFYCPESEDHCNVDDILQIIMQKVPTMPSLPRERMPWE